MDGVTVQPHIQLGAEHMSPVVLVVGDPARAALVASKCQRSRELAYNREYRSFECFHRDQRILVVSHGVGSAGCAICFEELIKAGARVIIRAGTAGSLQPKKTGQGDVVICESAVREDGVSALLVPHGFPAVADREITNELVAVGKELGAERKHPVTTGMTLTSDLFYKSDIVPSTLETFAKAKVDIVEMEVATLFTIARVKGIKAGALCTVDGSPFGWTSSNYDPTGSRVGTGKLVMIDVALEACARILEKKLYEKN